MIKEEEELCLEKFEVGVIVGSPDDDPDKGTGYVVMKGHKTFSFKEGESPEDIAQMVAMAMGTQIRQAILAGFKNPL